MGGENGYSDSTSQDESYARRTGFLIGSFGQDDWACDDTQFNTDHNWGIPVIDSEVTRPGYLRVWFFRVHQGVGDDAPPPPPSGDTPETSWQHPDLFQAIEDCLGGASNLEKSWTECTHLASLWHERKLEDDGDMERSDEILV